MESLLTKEEKHYKVFNELDYRISAKEISSAISSLKTGKSKGLDLVSNEMLKNGQTQLIPCLVLLFNFCLANTCYPQSWAKGYISPIFKSGDPTDPNNYRGITITSNLGKLFNTILNNRLDKFLEQNNLIHTAQIGFTKHARTTDHCFILKTLVDKYCNTKEGRLYACFIDFQKAFDNVIHCGLKLKLLQLNIGSKFYETVKNMYIKSETCVKINNFLTSPFPIKYGVRQGDNLSPNLLKIFINDLPTYLEKASDAVKLQYENLDCLMYADDIVIFSTSPEGLQNKLNLLENYCDDWGLKVNTNKTKIITFNKAGRNIKYKFLYKNSEIECVPNYKYLGIMFTASETFSMAKHELYKKSLKAYFKLRKNFLSLNPGIRTCLNIFDHTIKPILLYGSEIWGVFNIKNNKFNCTDNTQIDDCYKKLKCESLHQKFCKYILGINKKSVNHASLSELGRHPLHYNIVKGMLKYCYRLENLVEFPLLKDAFLCNKHLHYNHKTSWYSTIVKLFNILNMGCNTMSLGKGDFNSTLKKLLSSKYLTDWKYRNNSLKDGKLVTYLFLKSNFMYEEYLTSVSNYKYRSSICKFRVSSHRLLIETGRYHSIPRHERICKNCTRNVVEDEIHFLIQCDKFSQEREKFLKLVYSKVNAFSNLSEKEKFYWILNCEDSKVLNALGKFLHENLP